MLHDKLKILPDRPGVYLMQDSSGSVIYVGKAKSLKNRVRSYFTGSHDAKTAALISQIVDFEYILTGSEVEALVLECNLIKKHDPKYNIMLKDDKTYPYLVVSDEPHPRLLVTRRLQKGTGQYFGPYPNGRSAKEAARLLNRLFPFRKCRHIPAQPCLYYELGQCLGPCINKISPDEYQAMSREVLSFLRGDQSKIIAELTAKMSLAAEALQFERAREYRDLINDLKLLNEKQNITLNDFVDRDVIGYALSKDQICVQLFYFRQGKLVSRDNFVFPYYEEAEEALTSFLAQYYLDNPAWPQEILLPPLANLTLTQLLPAAIPQRGKKLELVRFAMSNAQTSLQNQITLEEQRQAELTQALAFLGERLGIAPPGVIETFDISHTAGTHAVAGMIQLRQGKPSRSNYRKYKLLPMETSDDTASIRQVVSRRYTRLVAEGVSLPDLILVDGGKGQIHAASEALKQLGLSLPVAGIYKDSHHRTAGLLNSSGQILDIARSSPAFRLLESIQEEVHRFAVTFHRQQRSKNMTLSSLDGISGIGPKRKQALLRYFKSIAKIRSATLEQLQAAGLTRQAAQTVYEHFRNPNQEGD